MPIVFAAISPHPPIILPSVGSKEDRLQVKKTIESLELLGKKLKELKPDSIIISAPHPDWGFNVPLFFLAKDFKGEIKTYLIGLESPQFYFEQGQKIYSVVGEAKEEKTLNEEDLKMVSEQTGASKEDAIKALEESNGGIAEAIMKLKKE